MAELCQIKREGFRSNIHCGPSSLWGRLFSHFLMCVLLNTQLLWLWEGWDPVNRFNHTSSVDVITQTDRTKSVCNRCVIEDFDGVYVLSRSLIYFPVGEGAFVIGLSQISFRFSRESNKRFLFSQVYVLHYIHL